MRKAFGSGILGALAVTAANQIGKRVMPGAPRLDVLGMRILSGAMKNAGLKPLKGPLLYAASFLGEMVSNSLFYSLIGMGRTRTAWLRGAVLGLAAGAGAAFLPEPLGLGTSPTARTKQTAWATMAWYLAGGLIAALTYQQLKARRRS